MGPDLASKMEQHYQTFIVSYLSLQCDRHALCFCRPNKILQRLQVRKIPIVYGQFDSLKLLNGRENATCAFSWTCKSKWLGKFSLLLYVGGLASQMYHVVLRIIQEKVSDLVVHISMFLNCNFPVDQLAVLICHVSVFPGSDHMCIFAMFRHCLWLH
jgi:hypothetical protein